MFTPAWGVVYQCQICFIFRKRNERLSGRNSNNINIDALVVFNAWGGGLYRVYQKKLNKPEIAHRLCKAPQSTTFFIEIGCLGTDNVV